MSTWQWDASLYEGSAEHYLAGRLPYPPEIADALRDALGLDRSGDYLDVGCGPGSLTLLLAPMFERATGVDADDDMVAAAELAASQAEITNVTWQCLRAEELPAGLGPQRLITFAQSFHWFDRALVASVVRHMLTGDGAVVHVGATTHEGIEGSTTPREQITELIQSYLGSERRAGRGTLPDGTPGGENEIFRRAGFGGPQLIEIQRGQMFERTEDEIVASVFSLSGSAPHLYGDRLQEFEDDLRALLRKASPGGVFHEKARDITLSIWR